MVDSTKKLEKERNLLNRLNVLKANKFDDQLSLFPELRYFQMNDVQVELSIKRSTDLSENILKWAFEMVKTHMQKKCEAADFAFTDDAKMKEMFDKRAWYLLAKLQGTDKCIGFSHFRFDMDCGYAVLYVYELHIDTEYQRTGLGTFIMNALETLATYHSMEKIILTALKNDDSSSFYDKLNFQLDESSLLGDVGYKIISKVLNSNKS